MRWTSIVLFSILLATTFASRIYFHRRQPQRNDCPKECDVNDGHVAVCGSDNKNYFNDCFLKKAICEDKTGTLKKVNSGVCPNVYGRLRGLVYTPVCGSNGVTYSHPYFLNLDACITKTYIQEVSKGPCGCVHDCNITNEDQTDLGCPPILNQVCGDDNQIYANECILNKQNVIFGGNAVKLMHDGACQAVTRRVIGMPPLNFICGNDGRTYTNQAFLDISKCQNYLLRKKHDGPCRH